MKRLSVAIWLGLCVALPASAQMYKWVDADGRVQYSDKPPPGKIKSEKLGAPARTVTPAASEGKAETPKDAAKDAAKAVPKTAAEQEQAFRKRQLEAAKAQEDEERKQAQASERAENCRRAKAALTSIQIGGRQMRIDENGERVYMDDQQIAQEAIRAREVAAAACN